MTDQRRVRIDYRHVRALLRELDLRRMFVEELRWGNARGRPFTVEASGHEFRLEPMAEQGGMVILEVCGKGHDGIPDRSTRQSIHTKVTEHAYEHILVFVNASRTASLWSWLRRDEGRTPRPAEHRFHVQQPGDSLLQRLEGIAFDWDELDDEGRASIVQVTDKVRRAFATNADRVTKRFYDEFRRQHQAFLKLIAGLDAVREREWYASVMLNRLMFIYFIQKKGFLDGDPAYLSNRLARCRAAGVPFYRGFLVPLFFEGFCRQSDQRSPEVAQLLGDIPFLDGGLFMPHPVEAAQAAPGQPVGEIDIPDEAFEHLFAFFDQYHWHLDDRPLRADNEINPDVLGYIFEKYINQKEMGAYYTKEDITEYITKNTVLPLLFDRLRSFCHEAVVPLPIADIEPYIHDAVRKGVDLPLPENIAAGLDDVSRRTDWNRPADPEYALPTETWREHVARRQRYQQILDDFDAGKITTINDFITYNLDIIKFAQDFIADSQDPGVVRAFYFDCLKTVTVLDPTCGSGAFLFAALNILEPLYEICLQRMEDFLAAGDLHPQWASPFKAELEAMDHHPSRRYFIYKSIVVNNLFGVDIMEEAVEICKLRLFLKLVAQVDDPSHIEALPDIDFNIRAGNTLVGYATLDEIKQAKAAQLELGGVLDRVRAVDRHLSQFRSLQMQEGISPERFRDAKADLEAELHKLEAELDRDLAFEYGHATPEALAAFIASHRPFHWCVQFYDIIQHGGFDVIIGNPPWVEYATVRRTAYAVKGYAAEPCGNLYALCAERGLALLRSHGRLGFIVQLPMVSAARMAPLRDLLLRWSADLHVATFDDRPARLFEGLEHCRASIFILQRTEAGADARPRLATTRYNRWYQEQRDSLLQTLVYASCQPQTAAKVLPKLSEAIGTDVLAKLLKAQRQGGSLGDNTVSDGEHYVFYQWPSPVF